MPVSVNCEFGRLPINEQLEFSEALIDLRLSAGGLDHDILRSCRKFNIDFQSQRCVFREIIKPIEVLFLGWSQWTLMVPSKELIFSAWNILSDCMVRLLFLQPQRGQSKSFSYLSVEAGWSNSARSFLRLRIVDALDTVETI